MLSITITKKPNQADFKCFIFPLINPPSAVRFCFETVTQCVWQTLTKELLELAFPAFQEKVIFPF